MPFHPPYNFIPATGKINQQETPKTVYEKIKKGEDNYVRHDLWRKDAKHGRILCRLHLHTPTVAGGMHIKGAPQTVEPYCRDGKPAIPGNSLRGMIGSVAEMLSQSALRVLEDKVYSVRERGKERQYLKDTTYDFFRAIDRDLLPWGETRRHHLTKTERSYRLTPAECLFGVVEEQEEGAAEAARNLAGRMRFSDARAIGEVDLMKNEVTLKILSSPKPPSPSMYFHHKNDKEKRRYISKLDLNAEDHRPNGRKVYLHHWKKLKQFKTNEWKTQDENDRRDQKMSCRPIKKGDFYFHLDFDNLSEAELGLLLTSLRPDEKFRHRLGLGKSLGLGSVEVEIEGVFLIDRVQRYLSDSLDAPRYHEVYRGPTPDKKDEWVALYPQEAAAWNKVTDWQGIPDDTTLIDGETLRLLKTVGNPDNLQVEVKPPMRSGQGDPEDETFKWFGENDKIGAKAQTLPVIKPGKPLQTLNEN
jgi:CRISPR/Cas system CSM-associated protein Csm3 (group 7 of RAMP superfamily)